MPEDTLQKDNQKKSINSSEEFPKKEKNICITNKLIYIICFSIIGFVGITFVNCNFMIPGSSQRAYNLGGLKNPPPLDCKESQGRGYDALAAILTTVIALKTKMD